jgi:uncharacterized membrane protein YeaQ/YmgE (transglycosylase-associated protein family)
MTSPESLASMVALFQGRTYFVGVASHRFLAWVIIGLLAGWIAGVITRGRGFGCLLNVILGLIGAVIGGWIFVRLGIPAWGFWASLAAATVGAVVLVAIGRLFAGGSSR